jgi:hypothetical protein
LTGVTAVASNNVWAVGENVTHDNFGDPLFHTLIEHFDGTRWSIVTSPTLPVGADLNAVTAISANNIWAVGAKSSSVLFAPVAANLIEHFDGTNWSVVPAPTLSSHEELTGVSGDSAGDVWAVGFTRGPLAVVAEVLHFNGTSWTSVPIPSAAGTQLSAVTALSPTNVWAVGNTNGGQTTLIEHFDGRSWSIIPSPNVSTGSVFNTNALTGIAAASANNIYAVGFSSDPAIDGGFERTLIEHWNGSKWTIVSSPNSTIGHDQLFGVTTRTDGTAIAVGTAGQQNGPNNTNGLIVAN